MWDLQIVGSGVGMFEPGLEHENVPQMVLPIGFPSHVLPPAFADGTRVKITVPLQPGFAEEVFCPFA